MRYHVCLSFYNSHNYHACVSLLYSFTFLGLIVLSLSLTAATAQVSNWELESPNFEGLRVNVDEGNCRSGWVMERMSLHDPIIIFNVESEVQDCIIIIYQLVHTCTACMQYSV
jgi:hypothetical protein